MTHVSGIYFYVCMCFVPLATLVRQSQHIDSYTCDYVLQLSTDISYILSELRVDNISVNSLCITHFGVDTDLRDLFGEINIIVTAQ